MTRERYNPVPFDVDATRDRWMQRKSFKAAYDALADEYAALGELLRARQAAGMTQTEVAETMGVAQSSVARLESSLGSRKHAPSLATLRKYADAVGCDLHLTLRPKRAKAKPAARNAQRGNERKIAKVKTATRRVRKRA